MIKTQTAIGIACGTNTIAKKVRNSEIISTSGKRYSKKVINTINNLSIENITNSKTSIINKLNIDL
jgi:hypothetical protein